MTDPAGIVHHYLLYFILPLWIGAGFADYSMHRRTGISGTSGSKEAFVHLLMVAEVGVPLLLALIFEINALLLAIMLTALVIHEATGLWDLAIAHHSNREVGPLEQHVHSFLEVLPLMAVSFVAVLHWEQFLALFGLGPVEADFSLTRKPDYWNTWYGAGLLAAAFLFGVAPFVEEYVRCRRQERVRNR